MLMLISIFNSLVILVDSSYLDQDDSSDGTVKGLITLEFIEHCSSGTKNYRGIFVNETYVIAVGYSVIDLYSYDLSGVTLETTYNPGLHYLDDVVIYGDYFIIANRSGGVSAYTYDGSFNHVVNGGNTSIYQHGLFLHNDEIFHAYSDGLEVLTFDGVSFVCIEHITVYNYNSVWVNDTHVFTGIGVLGVAVYGWNGASLSFIDQFRYQVPEYCYDIYWTGKYLYRAMSSDGIDVCEFAGSTISFLDSNTDYIVQRLFGVNETGGVNETIYGTLKNNGEGVFTVINEEITLLDIRDDINSETCNVYGYNESIFYANNVVGSSGIIQYQVIQLFNVTRTTGANTESNVLSFTPDYNCSFNTTLKIPVSNSVNGIVDVTNNTNNQQLTEVNATDDLVNNSYYFDSSNYYVFIRTTKLSINSWNNWTVNCTYGSTFNIHIPRYKEVGEDITMSGTIRNASDVLMDGITAKTHIYHSNGTDAVTPVHEWYCENGRYFCVLSTSTITPGIYSISIDFTDPTSGIIFKYGETIYISTDPATGIHVISDLSYNFYNNNTGLGINRELFKIYVSEDTSIDSSDRLHSETYDTYTGATLYYRIDDYFDNQIYPTSGDYQTLNITSTSQSEDVPIDWYSFSVKNMNHSIVRFNMTNGTRTYSVWLFPYEPYYFDVIEGEYNLSMEYYSTVDDSYEETKYHEINIVEDEYYWIRGYDLQDIVIEITAVNTSLDTITLSVDMNLDLINSIVGNVSIDVTTNLSAVNSSITNLINTVWNTINITDSLVTYLNNTIWNNFSVINSTIDTINNKLNINFEMLNVTVDYINNTIWTQFNVLDSNITAMNVSINSGVTIDDSNIATLIMDVWTSINLTDNNIDYLNASIWTNFTLINNTINSLDIDFTNTITLAENNITSLQFDFWNDINNSLKNRSVVMFNFYSTNDGIGLPWESLKILVDGQRLTEQLYHCMNGSTFRVQVYDFYNNTMLDNNFTIDSTFSSLYLGLTLHSWKFGNKNDDYYMISMLKTGASRWYEIGCLPFEPVEYVLPTGDYTLRIYDKNKVELYNSTYASPITLNSSRIYVIHGTNLSAIMHGLSTVEGDILQVSGDLDYALTGDVHYISVNPPIICSTWEHIGMLLGSDVWLICPPVHIVATTKNQTFNISIDSVPISPGNGTASNGTITYLEDIMFMSGNNSVTYCNMTYSDNGSLIGNYSYIPARFDANGQNISVRSDGGIFLLRETRYDQMKKFEWTYTNKAKGPLDRPGYHEYGLEIENALSHAMEDIYVFIGFSNETNPDTSTVTVYDVQNAKALKVGENFNVLGSGIDFRLTGSLLPTESRSFTFTYYRTQYDTLEYGDATKTITSYSKGVDPPSDDYDVLYNMIDFTWVNPYEKSFRGELRLRLKFDNVNNIDGNSYIVTDEDNNHETEDFTPGEGSITISSDALGDVNPGGSRNFKIYFLFEEYPGANPKEYHLDTPINWIGGILFTPMMVLFVLFVGIIAIGGYMVLYDKSKRKRGMVLISIGMCMIFLFLILQAIGV